MKDVFNEALQPLFERQNAIELMFLGMAIALHESGGLPLPKTVEVTEFMRLFAEMTESASVAERFDLMLDRLRAARGSGSRPRASLLPLIAMHAATQPQLREALRTWLNQATEDEIVEDLKELLAQRQPPSGDQH